MFQASATKSVDRQQRRLCDLLWKVAVALAVGTLLGALAAIPYDQLWGWSDSACTVLRSIVTVLGLTGLHVVPARDLVFDGSALRKEARDRRTLRVCS